MTGILNVLVGLGGAIIRMGNRVAASNWSNTATSAGFRMNVDGTCEILVGLNSTPAWVASTPPWRRGETSAQFEVRGTYVSGQTLSSGTLGAWLNMGSARSWTRDAPAGVLQETVFDIEIRRVGTTTVLATGRITLTADGQP